ncbi:MAG TPA: glucose 1-dehydrogenase [Burkholderiales bacterium]|nr:glucose 1-dehydrogenase [Burkholderiales bacterium]
MQAITLEPRRAASLALAELPEPSGQGGLLVRALALGVCGTDRELIDGAYGEAPAGRARLVLGHESLGRVLEAPRGCGFAAGDLVVGIVRHPDPEPCAHCAIGEWDLCSNGRYTERGIKQADGFAAERWRADPAFAVGVSPALGLAAVLLEPASILAKAWEHADHIGRRSRVAPRTVLVTGAGPVGLMGALMGMQRGLEVHVMDHNDSGPKPELVRALGARYCTDFPDFGPDVVIECTGAAKVVAQAVQGAAPGGIVCLTGLGGKPHAASLDVAEFNQSTVLGNRVVFGSVNANLRHYRAAADALERADRAWLERLLTRKVPLARWAEAYERRPGDVKTVLVFED